MEIKKVLEIIDGFFSGGCGDEYLDSSGNWELMCGKHIWKSKGVVKELRLCEDCIDSRNELKRLMETAEVQV